ncbi:MAG TPA: DUF2752 domain-containing protein [Pyrinomonadaceae bacterium]
MSFPGRRDASGLRRARLTSGLAGGALLASLALARGFASANSAAVYVAGGELPVVCVSRRLLGASCPGCGMTRSVLLTLGDDLRGALDANPGGPLLVVALLLLGAQLLVAASRRPDAGAGRDAGARRLLPWASAYAVVVASVMIINWAGGLFHA